MNSEKFKAFINSKFIEWEHAQGERGTVSGFAAAISNSIGSDVYQGDVSHWMKGSRIPGIKALRNLSKSPLIGPEVWEAAGYGYIVNDPLLLRTLASLESLPRPIQERFAEAAERAARNPGAQQELGAILQTV